MRLHLVATLVGALLLLVPAYAENTVPSEQFQEKLIKTSLITFNDANQTGIYTVMHARLAKAFRDQFGPDKLKQAFKPFVDQKAELGGIVLKSPIASAPSKIDERGALVLRGYFDTAPSRVTYELDYIPSEGEWKLIKINVTVKAPGQG